MKIIIVGCGKVGKTVAQSLVAEKHDIVLIDRNKKVLDDITNELDVLGYCGDGSSYDLLNEAGVKDADLLLAITDSDELNLICCLFAKKIGNVKTIARIRNPIFFKDAHYIRDELGLELIINPEVLAANEISAILRFPGALMVDTFAKGRLDLISFTVKDDSTIVNKKVMDISRSYDFGLIIAGIVRNDEAIIPHGNTVLMSGDVVSLVVRSEDANNFFTQAGIETGKVKSAMIIGGSNIAYYLAKKLISSGISVSIVEMSEKRCNELCELLPEANIILGDGTNEELLREEGINTTEAVVSLSGIDEENVLLSLYTTQFTNAKVVTKLDHIGYDDMLEKLDIGSIISPKKITSEKIIRFVRALDNSSDNEIETLYKILNGKAEALSFRIKEESDVTNKPLVDLKFIDNLLIGAIIRNGTIITPSGKDEIKVGDSVVVITTNIGLNDISDILA